MYVCMYVCMYVLYCIGIGIRYVLTSVKLESMMLVWEQPSNEKQTDW